MMSPRREDFGACLWLCVALLCPLRVLAEVEDELSAVQVSLQAPVLRQTGFPSKSTLAQDPVVQDLNATLKTQNTLCSSVVSEYAEVCRWIRSHGKPEEEVTDPVYSNLSPEAQKVLHSPTHLSIDMEVLAMLVLLFASTIIGYCIGGKYWVLCLCVSSYTLLIPGLFVKDFSYNIAINLPAMGMSDMLGLKSRIQVTSAHGRMGPVRESTRSFVVVLWNSGSKIGAILVGICAFLVPLVKLLLLGGGELWRSRRPKLARHFIQLAQVTSKWAAPDIFTFCVLYSSLKHMHHPPLVESLQILEPGFSCYSCFCVGSVLATCCIPLPVVEGETGGSPSLMLRFFDQRSVLLMVFVLAFLWAPLFVVGIFMPVIYLHLDTPTLFDSYARGINPDMLKTVLNLLNIDLDTLMNSKASIFSSTVEAFAWFFKSGDLSLLVMAIMMSVFVLVLSVCSVVSILHIATSLWRFGEANAKTTQASFLLRHLCLMDVCCVGVVIAFVSSREYRDKGLLIDPDNGLYLLIASEVLHWTMHNIILGVAEHSTLAEGKKI